MFEFIDDPRIFEVRRCVARRPSLQRDDGKTGDENPAGNGYWDLLRKSMSAQADQQEQRQILVDNIRIAAGNLKLQSTLMGAQPAAMVNGEMIREGDHVSGFRVLKIEDNTIYVARDKGVVNVISLHELDAKLDHPLAVKLEDGKKVLCEDVNKRCDAGIFYDNDF